MPALKLKFNTAQLKKALRECPEAIKRAEVRALNRAGVTMRAVGAREMRANLGGGVKIAALKDLIVVHNATTNRRAVALEVTGARIPLSAFSARGPMPSRGRGSGVSVNLKGGLKRHPHAFLVRFSSGHIGVMQRAKNLTKRSQGAWSKNLPIIEKFGPSLPRVFRTVSPTVRAAGIEALAKNLGSELNYELRRIGKTASLSIGSGLKERLAS